MSEIIKAYKGFDSELKCRGFQYEVGKTYECEDDIEVCENGFHACCNPLDVLDYYPLINNDCSLNRFCEVEQSGTIDKEDKKQASSILTIKGEIGLPGLIKASIEWIRTQVKKDGVASGNSSQLAASGYSRKLAASGNSSQLAASGYSSQLAASGYSSKLAASGYSSKLVASGNSSQLAASGNSSQLAASGYSSQLAASGDYSQLAASGDSSKLAASGDYSKLAASGDSSKLAASGDYSKLAASGYSSKLAASGDSSKLAASGDYSKLAASGKDSVVMCAGRDSKAKATVGSWITLAEWKNDKPVAVVTKMVDGKIIKADTWYTLKGGEFVEVD